MIATCTVCGHLYEAGSEEQAYEHPRYCAGTHCDNGGIQKQETVRESLNRRGLESEPVPSTRQRVEDAIRASKNRKPWPTSD